MLNKHMLIKLNKMLKNSYLGSTLVIKLHPLGSGFWYLKDLCFQTNTWELPKLPAP